MLTFEEVLFDPERDHNAVGWEVLKRIGSAITPENMLDPGPFSCPACGAEIADDDEETWYLPEGVFWHDECYISEAMPIVGTILGEEYERRIANGE